MSDKAHTADLRKMRRATRLAARHMPLRLPTLFALTDPKRTPDPIALAQTLPHGAGLIYRHFGASSRYKTAKTLARICRRRHLVFLIGNDPSLAATCKADGVHWSEATMSNARRWRRRFALMTAAAHSRKAVQLAADTRLDAALYSTVFASNSPSSGQPIGILRFRCIAQASHIPVYALGGVKASNVESVAKHGGVAAIEGLLPRSA